MYYISWMARKRTFHEPARGHCGRDQMVVGFITTYAISDYQH
jgi:hypothetical protein